MPQPLPEQRNVSRSGVVAKIRSSSEGDGERTQKKTRSDAGSLGKLRFSSLACQSSPAILYAVSDVDNAGAKIIDASTNHVPIHHRPLIISDRGGRARRAARDRVVGVGRGNREQHSQNHSEKNSEPHDLLLVTSCHALNAREQSWFRSGNNARHCASQNAHAS